ncbi:MAG: 3-oxoacyl-[acyl-carrier-protein] reductase FabG [Alphaproteobacteria bacterium MarineAlpha5_Bin9]|nr:MAG: 3-oxoacyl-[acyl-carrier-protein] reductase FabG [Alphaproteobacteria bacterium MarineAlpha5_Bin9]|tara:strand:- start:67 stop:792 length:726 start_codon:yes stop_codon:yes gene_type:complete
MIKEKVAVLIAAGSGMGADAAKKLASDGFKISILSSSGKGEALANKLGGIGITGSNQSNEDLKKIIDKSINKWGRIDVLVNSAGHGPKKPLLDLTDEDWIFGMNAYFMNIVRSVRLVTPIMQKQKSGVIINISTFAAFEPDPISPTSGFFRAGLANFTKLYSDMYAAENIRINNILPGFIDSMTPEKKKEFNFENFLPRIPLNRFGKLNEISDVVSFLASNGATYITGQNIRVDGGITRSV